MLVYVLLDVKVSLGYLTQIDIANLLPYGVCSRAINSCATNNEAHKHDLKSCSLFLGI